MLHTLYFGPFGDSRLGIKVMAMSAVRISVPMLCATGILISLFLAMPGNLVFAQSAQWPGLAHRTGPYGGITQMDDVSAAARDGFNLTVLSTTDPAVLTAMRNAGMKYIDNRPWNLLIARCRVQLGLEKDRGETKRCSLSDSDKQALLDEVDKHLQAVKNDPGVAAYWILDDYPSGNVSATLASMHDLIARANSETHAAKPTICGIGGSLDRRASPDSAFKPDREYIWRALENVTPAACDVIAPYFYGTAAADDPTWVDWTMSDLLKEFSNRLRQRGFARPVLMPVLHAFSATRKSGPFYYVHPTPDDIATQAAAYCRMGAVSLMFFTWDSRDADRSYKNDQELQEGVRRARQNCWAQ